jgi:hypothetical protein
MKIPKGFDLRQEDCSPGFETSLGRGSAFLQPGVGWDGASVRDFWVDGIWRNTGVGRIEKWDGW